MALFRKKKEPINHPDVARDIYLKSPVKSIEPRLAEYGQIMGSRARQLPLTVATADDWLRLRPPTKGVHPWEVLNLACYLQELGPVVLTSAESPTFPAHWLVPSTSLTDLFEGYTATGEAISIEVPSNRVVRSDPDVEQSVQTTDAALAGLGVPTGTWLQTNAVIVHSDDPLRDLGPTLEDSVASRRNLRFATGLGGII